MGDSDRVDLKGPQESEALVVFFDIVGFSNQLKQRRPAVVFEDLVGAWTEIRKRSAGNAKRLTYLFSDCGFLLYPLTPETKRETYFEALNDIRSVLDEYLSRGFLLRGAVSVGSAAFGPHLLVGQPVVDAVRSEEEDNPGPFVLIPAKERQKVISDEEFISDVCEMVINLKNGRGQMLSGVALPSNVPHYISHLQTNAAKFLVSGPYHLATFYRDALDFMRQHFAEWFESSTD